MVSKKSRAIPPSRNLRVHLRVHLRVLGGLLGLISGSLIDKIINKIINKIIDRSVPAQPLSDTRVTTAPVEPQFLPLVRLRVRLVVVAAVIV